MSAPRQQVPGLTRTDLELAAYLVEKGKQLRNLPD